MRELSVLIVVVLGVHLVSAQQFATLMKQCHEQFLDRFNECFISAVKRMQPTLVKGNPELNVPSLDPLHMGNISFTQREGPVTVDAFYSDVAVSGVADFDIKYLDLNLQNGSMLFGVTVPSILVRGQYKIGGRVFELPVVGEGAFGTNLTALTVSGYGEVRPHQGFLRIGNIVLDFSFKTLSTKMHNLFPDNQVLSDTIHHFLNNNHEALAAEIRPEVSRQLSIFFAQIFNRILPTVPAAVPRGASINTNDKHRKKTLQDMALRRNDQSVRG
ncbi:protein takeout [Hyalella azteca]|uniref:Protein takeout n=1 Tax=Hyalella azteca TaxID=294128 RepID=A0A8B7ND41_HYAAZ|nr:protein takeout [Hyalella azteca]